jgi:uncharacterized flavoprotein (TIGR03862 family)
MLTERNVRAVVVGGGPAGLMAAETLLAGGLQVTLVDHRRSVGRKFLLAGRSGLNLTHSEPLDDVLARFRDGSCVDLVHDAVRSFPPDAVRAWAEGLGEQTVVGSSGRVFPASWRATPLLRSWVNDLISRGLHLHTRLAWHGFGDGHTLLFSDQSGQTDELVKIDDDVAIFALGGASWPNTGSDGGWLTEFERADISVTTFRPANAGVVVKWTDIFRSRFEGMPLKHVRVSSPGLSPVTGDLVVTKDGFQGGPVYALSSQLRYPAVLAVDLRPDESVDSLTTKLLRARHGDSMSTRLRKCGLSDVSICLVTEVGGRSLSRVAHELAKFIKGVPIEVTAAEGMSRAISVAGGVDRVAVDDHFMLRRWPGIFLAGEMLDWDAPTGGYLLQACLSTGRAAAQGAIAWATDHSLHRLG